MKQSYTKFNLSVSIFKEGEYFVAYLPALDLSTSAKTFSQVQKRVQAIVQIFFEELQESGTTEEVLENLGWLRHRKQLQPPVVVSHELQEVSVPVFA
ncbi:MAG: hypothetical protein A2445_04315 [Candidatus Jacksonbacteria bacterium RIFOXYC2_FULL_44_29]|nr:MAG: hypothetical protein UW45_C0044G0001 [Parcubacteria group bacterium GW2011_GWC2_44_22]OGY76248.1 MAG: hypothetical protein A2240_00900 [Candidatus Jacksonbacteria bacterium RIFOXYA2_FULL_43_12]OGY76667.1 MAG: hypothetical protein A2295_05025 [Candidatus Jacksonbacteria bacterium RIFOXYB2_FULL_44_15]OGY78041.1 MAG: hypothetical protein A2550_03360 [Candidatus Jacksonbacteria bacterium RIFOXYD2_FULL_43_21]OGY79453.1 MAG: hypothetical protein A2445_04315 [Candidatus Jacksonbacteria bacteri